MNNIDDTALFFLFANVSISSIHNYIEYSIILSIYFPQKFRKSILITLRNRNAVFRLIRRADRVLKIEPLKKDDFKNLL
jgi:hypothetical protein